MEINIIRDAFERVANKQRASCSKTQEGVNDFSREIRASIERLQSGHESLCKAVLAELKNKLKEKSLLSQLGATYRELMAYLNRYAKLLEKSFNPDISKAFRHVDPEIDTINQIMVRHLYRQCLFEIGDFFSLEAMKQEPVLLIKSPYVNFYQILESLTSGDLEPALKWAMEKSSELRANGSDHQLKLHQRRFLEILEEAGLDIALQYAGTYLPLLPLIIRMK
ncbi:hypothetical protein SAY87_029026 [Trapa incisa]|uniref:CTLH domain-containing protein n=1 Tax=Trapa incisa TaxID=236973 RepID=A0AAN7L3Y7_9MYRT|nr:hypothetical protein SAY87_029026 [Trapa incisa]